jgi:lysophospholipase L1-like esterase
MTKYYKRTLVAFALLLSALMPVVSNAQTAASVVRPRAPKASKIVFIGDWITYSWTSAFTANKNWINEGTPGQGLLGRGNSAETAARFQADVVSLHPAIVHIMIGASDADETFDSNFVVALPDFLANLEKMVKEAKAANIKVILAMEPSSLSFEPQYLEKMNAVIVEYGAANNIPVINYEGALCGCNGSGGGTGIGYAWANNSSLLNTDSNGAVAPSAVGYSLMTQMAKTAIATMNLILKTGWLQNVQQVNTNEDNFPAPLDVNTVAPGAVIEFTPMGLYNDGSRQPLYNSNFQSFTGTWTSSNPLVIYVSPTGLAWAISSGSAIIRYTSPNGIGFSEWIMHITG